MNNSSKKELSVKSTFIQKNMDMSGSFYYNNEENTTNQQSKENQILNEKIIKLYINKHPLLSMKTIKKLANFNFTIQYTKNEYNSIVVNHIIHNDPGHIVAEFKDFLIAGDINEFLQKSYKINEIKFLLPKICEYYINSSVIFPNYVKLPESKYIYKNIQKKQKVIDAIQDQEDKDERIKKGLFKEEEKENVFTTQIVDSILNQTDTSGIKQYFGINTEGNSLEISKLNNIINDINSCDNKNLKFKNSCHINEYYTQSSRNETNNNNRTSGNNLRINIRDKIMQKQNSRNTKCYIKKKQNDISSLKSKNKSKMSLEINKIIMDNGSHSNKNFKNIKNSYNLDKRGIQLSNSIKNINELTLNNRTNNGVLLRSIYSRNKDIPNKKFSKNKKEEDKNNKNKSKESFQKGRNFTSNFIKNNNYNNYYNTTNNINGGADITYHNHNSNSNSKYNINNKNITKCITSRQFYKLENNFNNNELGKTLYKNAGLKNERNSFKSNDNFSGGNKKIIKKSIINKLLNNNKELHTEENSSIFKNRKSIKTSFNGCIFESIAKSTFFSDRNNTKEKGSRRHLFSGLSQKDNNMKISQNKNNNKLFNSCSLNNMMNSYRTINKNYSCNNIINCINNTSNLSNTHKKKDSNREFMHIYQKECKSQQKEKHDEISRTNNKKVYTSNFNLNDKEKEIEKKKEFFIKSYNNKNNMREYFDKKNRIDSYNNNNQFENCIFKNFKNDNINKNNKSLNSTNCLVHKKKASTIINNKKEYSIQNIISEKKIAKEPSENNIISETLNSPANSIYTKKFYIKSDLREKQINFDIEKPLTLRKSINKNDINDTEKIELLTKKINEMKRCMKESSEKNTNSISNIFKNKKIKRKNQTSTQNFKKQKNNNIDSARNNDDNILLSDTIAEVTIKNIYMNNNLINKVKKENENKKLIRDNRQTMSNDDILGSNKITRKTMKDFRSNSNYLLEGNISKVNNNASKKYKFNNKEMNTESNFNKKFNYINENIPINVDKSNKNNKEDISLINKMKSYSLKVLPIKQINKNKVNIKGIHINGFEKILKKKNNNNARNNDIPLSVTERLKYINESSYLNSSNRYINTSNNNTKIFQKKKISDNSKRK